MTDQNKTIRLVFRREDFEDIYFKEDNGNIFWGKSVKQYFIAVLIFISTTLISLAYSLYKNEFWGSSIAFIFMFIIAFFLYARQAAVILKWKKQVVAYLDQLSKAKKHEIILSNEAFTFVQDDEAFIAKWVTFTKAILASESISLIGSDTYLLPKKSMHLNDYEFLKQFISDKVQNGI